MDGFKDYVRHLEYGYTEQEIINFYLNHTHKRVHDLARETNTSVGDIYRILHSHNVKPNRLKTNTHNVLYFSDSGLPVSRIAELTGYTPRNVRYILSKLTEHGRDRN